MATLIKIDRNGSKHYEGYVTCDRCGGQGTSEAWKMTGWTCYKCGGSGKVFAKWIERTPEYQAKLDAKRKAKMEAQMAEAKAQQEEMQKAYEQQKLEEEAEEARIKAQKAISQFVGQIGDKIEIKATFDHTAWFTAQFGWSEETVYIHTFKDANGNVLTWKTSSNSLGNLNEGDEVNLKGTIKDHTEYKDEKQTVLTRCKVSK